MLLQIILLENYQSTTISVTCNCQIIKSPVELFRDCKDMTN